MKIHVTSPFAATDSTSRSLRAYWRRAFPTAEHIVPESPYQIHGDLLTEIYAGLRDDLDPLHVITEADFIPESSFEAQSAAYLQNHAVVLSPYVTRSVDGALLEHPPLAGAWYIGLNLDLLRAQEPPLTWLSAGGPFNDAANFAYSHLEGRFDGAQIHWLDHETVPSFFGLRYPGLGIHCFGQRHFADNPASDLFIPGYTVGHHLAQIANLLKDPA